MKRSSRFPAVGESVIGARRFVAESIVNVPSDVADALLVIASELATNCIRHGASTFEMRVDQLPDREPVVRSPAPYETSGRGLQIVGGLADSWGVARESDSSHKTVWAVVAIHSESV
jgi:hypothetical protein